MPKEVAKEKEENKQDTSSPRQPCEILLWNVVPCIRASIARELVERGFTQQKVGDLLGVSQSAISQYLSEKRGNLNCDEEIDQGTTERISAVAEQLAEGETNELSSKICDICRYIQENSEMLVSCGISPDLADRLSSLR